METRRRGRDARASTEQNRSPSSNPHPNPATVPPNNPPSTRSRTRRATAAQRTTRTTRSTRATSSGPATRSSSATHSQHARSASQHSERPRRASASRRTPAQTSPASTLTPSQSTRATRKRTRSISRTQSAPSAPSPSSGVAAGTAGTGTQATSLRPSKRPRRASNASRQPRNTPGASTGAGPSNAAPSPRRTRGMSSANPSETGDERQSDQSNQRRDEEGPSSLGSDRAGPTTLQGLLRRLGADLSDIFPGNVGTSHTRLQQLRSSIVSPDTDEQQIDALSELCEFLSVGTEESLVSFSVNLFVGPLVNLLRTGANVEIKIYAARALTHMMEALPSSSSAIAINGAAGPLCQNLLSIEYIDLAEQSLSALHKLSVDYPQQIVSANGFQAVLSFIDFFSLGVQRVAASTACNLCRLPRGDAMDMISGVLPTMMRLLGSEDQRIRESAILGFTRLAEAFRSSSEKLEILCGESCALIEKVLGLIVPSSPPALSPQSYSSALRLLALLSRGSAKLGLQILSTNSLILKLQSRLNSGSTMHSVDCLHLADSLLPDIPELEGTQGSATRSRRRRSVGSLAAIAAVDAKRREKLEQNVDPLKFFGSTLFDTLMKFYISSADSSARRVALSILSKFIAIAPQDVLLEVITKKQGDDPSSPLTITTVRFCPFVAALLGENSSKSEALVGLAMAASALQKLPSLRDHFVREGVVHEIVRLAALDTKLPDQDPDDQVQPQSAENGAADAGNAGSGATEGGGVNMPETAGGVNVRDMDSVWTAVASLQRGTLSRGLRGDLAGTSQRLPSRTFLDFRLPHTLSMQAVVPKAARSILTTYLGADADGTLDDAVLQNTVLGRLTAICDVLKCISSPRDEAKGHKALSNLVKLLTASEGLTVFEISRSGVMEAVAKYLTSQDPKTASARIATLVRCLNEDPKRGAFASLVDLALGVLSAEEKLTVQTNESAHGTASVSVSAGLRQLAQPFKLRLRKAAADADGSNLRDYSHHVVLIEPLATMASVQEFLWPKVREAERSSGAGPSGGTRQRSARNESSGGEDGEDDEDAGNSGSGEGDNGQDDGGIQEDRFAEMFDIEEENHVEDEVMGDDEEEHNTSDEEVSSGEEDVIEQDAGDSDDHEHDGADSLDVDQIGSSLPPFEVDHEALGQAPSRGGGGLALARDGNSRSGSASRSDSDTARHETTFRSYAAALAANIPRGADQHSNATGGSQFAGQRRPGTDGQGPSNRPAPVQKLSFTLNGKALAHDCSILTAVIQSSAEGRGIGPRLWSEVHTLVYSKCRSSATTLGASQSLPSMDKEEPRAPETAGPVRRSQRLQESRGKSNVTAPEKKTCMTGEPSSRLLATVIVSDGSVPVPLRSRVSDLPESIASVVDVLKQLHWVYEKMNDTILREDGVPNHVEGLKEYSNVQFVSHKLSAKLIRQLSDPLALCGGVIPTWCFALAREATFLIPFETRRILFQSTSLGVSRALHLLQTRTEMSGLGSTAHRSSRSHRESEARIGRIQRQKVRVYRNRILESAIKVMNMYSTHSTVLEVEYFDEAGTGLGPTLEFYTLASREIQRVDLGLWRGSAATNSKEKENSTTQPREDAKRPGRADAGRPAPVRRRSRRSSTTSIGKLSESLSGDDEVPAYIIPTGNGLFPSCLPIARDESQKESSSKTTALFGFVGRLIGKAMIDGRLLDLRFSSTFSRLLVAYSRVIYEQARSKAPLDQECVSNGPGLARASRSVASELEKIDREEVWDAFTAGSSALSLLMDVDSQLARSLKAIIDMVREGQRDAIPSLCLTFVLPGDDSIELVKNGSNIEVTGKNADEFVQRVVYHVLFGGVYQQAEGLLRGLGDLIDVTNLLTFEAPELELLVCGPSFEKWTVEFLVQATRCDHGYSHESDSVLYLLRILSELDQEDQQRFVQFTTGSPALPLGGLRSLHPRLTIVRRTPESGRSPDECLPTVMTCTNYFKLPDYSSFEIAKKQIMYAVREGQRSFHLS